MKSLCLAAALALLATSPGLAQSAQQAGRSGQISGACGQPLALTYSLSLPVDQIPAAPLRAAFVRVEPFYLEFALSRPERVALRTETSEEATDPYLTLMNASGAVIDADDDGAGGYNALLDLALQPGSYCAQVRPLGGDVAVDQAVTLILATGAAAEELAQRIDVPAGPGDLCTDPALTADLDRTLAPGFGSLALQASIDPQGRRDWRITVTEPMDLQVDATSGQFDTVLVLVDAAGNVVAENDDGFSSGTDSRIAASIEPGSYCLSLSGFDGESGLAAIALTDTPEAPIPGPLSAACTDPALTSDLGRALGPGFGSHAVAATLPTASRSDWRFEVTGEALLQFDATSDEFDTLMSLLDGSGALVEQNDDEPNSVNSRIVRTLAPGSYCLTVEGFGGGGGGFEIAVTDTPSAEPSGGGAPLPAACADPALTSDLGRALAPGFGSHSVGDRLAPGSRSDWRFEVTEEVLLQFDATSGDFDTLMRLADGSGALIEENDDEPMSINSRIVRSLAPGSYCVSVGSFGGGDGNFELAVTDTPSAEPSFGGDAGLCTGAETADLGRGFAPGFGSFSLATELSGSPRQDFRLSVGDGMAMRFAAQSTAFDTVLRLGTPDGPVLAENDDGPSGGTDSSFDHTLSAGDYCLSLEAFAGGEGAAVLTLSEIDAGMLAAEAVLRGEAIPGPDSGVEIEEIGALADRLETQSPSEDQTKWVGFTVAEEGGVRIDAISLGGAFTLRLFTEAGTVLDEAYSGGGISPARIEKRLPAGRYLLAVALEPYVSSRLRSIVITAAGG